MYELRFSKPELSPQRKAELSRLSAYMRTGHLRPNPSLCRHGIDTNAGLCWICEDPTWARTCPKCGAGDADPLTLDGFNCRVCPCVYSVEGHDKFWDKTEVCEACDGTGKNFFSCCGDDMRGEDLDNCPTCHEHTGWDGHSDGECIECSGSGKQ